MWSWLGVTLPAGDEAVGEEGEGEEDEAEGEGEGKVATAGFEDDGGGEDAGLAVDIATNEHDGTDFADGGAEAGDEADDDAVAGFAEDEAGDLGFGGAEGLELPAEVGGDGADGGHGHAGNEGEGEDGLGDDHGGGGEEPIKAPGGALAGEDKVNDEADNDGREAHAGVDGGGDPFLAAELVEAEPSAAGNADDGGQDEGGTADEEGKGDDLPKGVVTGDDESDCFSQRLDKHVIINCGWCCLVGRGESKRGDTLLGYCCRTAVAR